MTQQPTTPGRPTTHTNEPPHYNTKQHCTVNDPSYVSEVDGKQLRFRPKMPLWKRFEVIREKYGSCSKTELALFAGVSVRQIDRDLNMWFATDEYRVWVRDQVHEWFKDEEIPKTVRFHELVNIYRDLLNGRRVDEDKEVCREDEQRILKTLAQYNVALAAKTM